MTSFAFKPGDRVYWDSGGGQLIVRVIELISGKAQRVRIERVDGRRRTVRASLLHPIPDVKELTQ